MATKQTIADLIGNTDKRVQVNYDPSEITLSPTVQQTRGSGTVVQGMPQTNQLLNFSRALNQVPQVLGQVKNIGQAQAKEDFSQITDEDEKDRVMGDDKTVSRWLGYDKAFQEELVKDYFVRNQKTITQRFTDLANNPAQYGSDGEFDAAITNEKNTLIQELQEEFGNNPNRVLAINAFGDNVLTKVVGETTAMYEANKINYTLDIKGSHLADQIKAGEDPSVAFKGYLADIKALDGVGNKEAKAQFVTQSFAIGTELKNNGQYARAKEVVEAALNYQFYKGAKISGEERTKLSNLLTQIEDGQEQDVERKTTSIATEVRRASESVSYSLIGKEIKAAPINQMEDVFTLIRPNVDLDGDSVAQFFETLTTTKDPQARIRLYNDFLLQLGQGTIDGKPASDLSKEIFNLSSQNLLQTQIQLNSVTPEAISGLTDTQVKNLTSQAFNYFTANRNDLPETMLRTYGFAGAKVPTELQTIYDKIHAIDYISEVPAYQNLTESDVTNRLKLAFGSTRDINKRIRAFDEINLAAESAARSNSIYNLLEEDIKDFARNAIIGSEINKDGKIVGEKISIINAAPAVRNKAIGDFIDAQMAEYVEIENELFKGKNLFKGLYDEAPLTGSIADITDDFGFQPNEGVSGSIEEAVERTVDDSDYEHLKYSNIKKLNKGEYRPSNETLSKAYETHRKNNEIDELSATMLIHGYDQGFDPESANDLKKTRLGINEVRLFKNREEFVDILNKQWSPILTKVSNDPDSLTEQEKETLKVLTSFGIVDEQTLRYFGEVQSAFLK